LKTINSQKLKAVFSVLLFVNQSLFLSINQAIFIIPLFLILILSFLTIYRIPYFSINNLLFYTYLIIFLLFKQKQRNIFIIIDLELTRVMIKVTIKDPYLIFYL